MDEISGHRAAIEKLALAKAQDQRDTRMMPNPLGPIASTIGLGVPTINPVTLTMRVGILEDRISRMEQEFEKVMIILTDRLGALETKLG